MDSSHDHKLGDTSKLQAFIEQAEERKAMRLIELAILADEVIERSIAPDVDSIRWKFDLNRWFEEHLDVELFMPQAGRELLERRGHDPFKTTAEERNRQPRPTQRRIWRTR